MTEIPHNEETDEIYRLYGQAAHHCFNIGVCCMFLLQGPELRKNHKLSEWTPDIIDKIGIELDLSTLGTLLKKLKKHYDLRKGNVIYLKKVLKTRNYLTHKFFGTYGKRMYLPDTWPVMKEELQELLSFLEDASYIFIRWSRIDSWNDEPTENK
jgi:uncharacterized protein with HEPN domain